MRRVTGLLLGCLLVVGLWLVASCTEDSVTTTEDRVGPTTELIFPISSLENQVDISDSVDIYVKARDDQALSRVEIWSTSELEEESERLAELTDPLSSSEVPDSLWPDDGSDVFGTRWYTRLIRNGTVVRLFSRAYDEAGNSARSDLVVVRILNEGGDLFPPEADFTVTPPRGTVNDIFRFDASSTRDEIDDPEQIVVRWDLDGDGVWEYDFDEELPATAAIEHKYSHARIYTVKLEAKNTYLPGQVGSFERALEVGNVGGDPAPPEPEEMILILAGTYPVGTADTSSVFADEDEYPLHEASMTTDFYIRRTEVPNRLYLRYIHEEMNESEPRLRRDGSLIYDFPDRVDPVEEDSLPRVILDLNTSVIYYDPDGDTMAVRLEDRNLPVVGVTWHGAKSYAEHFGLRLPTEHEWEIAAKGSNEQYLYPWGLEISPEQANYNDPDIPTRALMEIGSFPGAQSPFGLLDLSGNAKEWVKDWYGPYSAGQQSNPEGPILGETRVIRGGSYLSTEAGVRVTGREAAVPEVASGQIGFRTAYIEAH